MTNDKQTIIETVTRLVWAIDRHDFVLAGEQFTDEIALDYSSLFGGAAEILSSQTVIDRWSSFLPKLKMTQHTLSNFSVEAHNDRASCMCYVQGFHFLPYSQGGSRWLVLGYYTYQLAKADGVWKINYMKLSVTYEEGNRNILSLAATAPVQKQVSFESMGSNLRGILFLPADYKDGDTLPAVIVIGSWTTVKEQMSATYALQMARQGFAALTFDFRGWGESEGYPRQYESFGKKAEDLKNAISFLQTRSEIDSSNIMGLAICASAGYMAMAASQDKRLKAWAAVAPWLHNRSIVNTIYGGEEGVQEKINLAENALREWNVNQKDTMVPACSTTDPQAPMYGNWDYYLNPQRGAIPAWKNEFNVLSWKDWLSFDPVALAPQINCPVCLIHSEEAAIPQGVKQFYDGLQITDKQMIWLKGNQFDFYDDEATVVEAAKLSAHWLKKRIN